MSSGLIELASNFAAVQTVYGVAGLFGGVVSAIAIIRSWQAAVVPSHLTCLSCFFPLGGSALAVLSQLGRMRRAFAGEVPNIFNPDAGLRLCSEMLIVGMSYSSLLIFGATVCFLRWRSKAA